jgi:hypothetical protein
MTCSIFVTSVPIVEPQNSLVSFGCVTLKAELWLEEVLPHSVQARELSVTKPAAKPQAEEEKKHWKYLQ